MKRVFYIILLLVCIEGGTASTDVFQLSQVDNIVKSKLQAYGRASDYGFDSIARLKHEIVGIYDIYTPKDSKKLIIASTAPSQNYECHACAPKISYFFIQSSNGAWRIERSYINAHSMGEWGNPPSKEEYQVIRLNDNTMGLFLKVFWATQGYSGSRIFLYTFEGGKAREIFNQEVALENGATGSSVKTDWKAKFSFVRGGSKFYDVVLDKRGVEKDVAVDQKLHYLYDGSKYVLKSSTIEKKSDRKKFISVQVRNRYRAVVTAGKEYFDFDLSGHGDTVGLRIDKNGLDSLHMLAMDACRRDSKGKLVDCDSGIKNPALDYSFDGQYFDMKISYDWRSKRDKTEIYNDNEYIYWADFTDGKVKSLEKFKIERVE